METRREGEDYGSFAATVSSVALHLAGPFLEKGGILWVCVLGMAAL